MMVVGFVMIAATLFSNGQVQSQEPVSEFIYHSLSECRNDISYQLMLKPQFKASNIEIACGEVVRGEL